jgi:hypothetical protein
VKGTNKNGKKEKRRKKKKEGGKLITAVRN